MTWKVMTNGVPQGLTVSKEKSPAASASASASAFAIDIDFTILVSLATGLGPGWTNEEKQKGFLAVSQVKAELIHHTIQNQ